MFSGGNACRRAWSLLASVYSGHQFGVWAGQLGDGRALLLGEVDSPAGPLELQLKGSGLTPYSRMGDGRAVLRSSIREFLCSEAMHALGIPTTRALCIIGSAPPVRRETIETAAVVTRVAPSFLRFGHFEHFAHTAQDIAALRRLVDFVIDALLPRMPRRAEPVLALLEEVARARRELMAQWQAVGFCHGVMNTDNMSILGLTIDYGPFGFLDVFDPGHICNHCDHQGRYAYARQPSVACWNLHALAQALLPLLGGRRRGRPAGRRARALSQVVSARDASHACAPSSGLADRTRRRPALIDDLLKLMAADRRRLHHHVRAAASCRAPDGVRDLFVDRAAFDAWAARYAARLRAEGSIDAERACG